MQEFYQPINKNKALHQIVTTLDLLVHMHFVRQAAYFWFEGKLFSFPTKTK